MESSQLLDPKVLGQLLIMQSYIGNLPEKKTIFNFICKGLLDIPGVNKVEYIENYIPLPSDIPCRVNFKIELGNSDYGSLIFDVKQLDKFSIYEPYIRNFIFMLAVLLEERNLRSINEKHNQELEQKIDERTSELLLEKQNLIESQRRFTDLMTNIHLLSVMLDKNGDIIFCNQHLLKITNYTENEIIGKNWFELFLPGEIVLYVKDVFNGIMCGRIFNSYYENEIKTKNGENLLIAWNNTLLKDSNQNIIGTASIGEDITQRKKDELLLKEKTEEIEAQNEELFQTNQEVLRAKELLEHSEEKFRIITLSTPDHILVQDTDLVYTMVVNPQLGLTQEDMIGKTDYDFLSLEEAEKLNAIKKNVLETRQPYHLETPLISKSGEIEFFDGTFIPWIDSQQNIKGLMGYFKNTTERKKMIDLLKVAKEKAEESDRLKTAFLQNMSHEIRTPMNAIMGFSELLIPNFNNKEKLYKFSDIIGQRCKDLLEIINDILDISRIESGQLKVTNEEIELSEFFEELKTFFAEFQRRYNKQNINLFIKAEIPIGLETIIADRIKIKQIFVNLLSNAFKFTELGHIEMGCNFADNNHIDFYVLDTGVGIPADKQDVIFNRFVQLNNINKQNIGGTGLGLSIVKGLLDLLNGQIKINSQPGVGSRFTFTVPFKVKHKTEIKGVSDLVHQNINIQGKTILIVEDDFYNAEFLKEILEDEGCNILLAENGEISIEIAQNNTIDLVLMDIRLPGINGYEALKKIKLFKPDLKFIAQTAYASPDEKKKAIDEGCIDYISKPTRKDMLLEMIQKYIHQPQ